MRSEFDPARDLLDEGVPKAEYTGVAGYRKAADDFKNGSMDACWNGVAKSLSKKQRVSLNWGKKFSGSTAEHSRIPARLFAEDGKPLPEMCGVAGYRHYSEQFCNGVMARAFMMVSAVLTPEAFKKLGWGKSFNGTPAEQMSLRTRVYDKDGRPLAAMCGVSGYRLYSDSFCKGDMSKTYRAASAALSSKEFRVLGWGKSFLGSTAEHAEVKSRLLDEAGDPLPLASGVGGYRNYADRYCDGSMAKAFQSVSAVLTPGEFRKLGWGKSFLGNTTEYAAVRSWVLDDSGKPLASAVGVDGYRLCAETQFLNSMSKAYQSVSTLLSPEEFAELGWGKKFDGTTSRHREIRARMLDENSVTKEELHGSSGYHLYADKFCVGSMLQAFKEVSAVLSPEEFAALKWGGCFFGSTAERDAVRSLVLDADGKPYFQSMEIAGYRWYADTYCLGNMSKAFTNVGAVMNPEEFRSLGWGKIFPGTTAEHVEVRRRVLDDNDNALEAMRGVKGYIFYADSFCNGRMIKAAQTVSAVLSAEERYKLGWGRVFNGSTAEHAQLRRRVLHEEGAPLEEMQFISGYRRYADSYCVSDMKKAHRVMSVLLSEDEFNELKWGKCFAGTTSEHRELRERVLDEVDEPREEIQGSEGYRRYADQFCVGNMITAYSNASAVLNADEFEQLRWGKAFGGTTADYEEVRARVLDERGKPRDRMQNVSGYRCYAESYCLGSMNKAFVTVSAVLSGAEFDALNWGKSFSGSTEEHAAVRLRVLDDNGKPLPLMQGTQGYLRYAECHCGGSMSIAFTTVSAVLTPGEFQTLDWGRKFDGTPKLHRMITTAMADCSSLSVYHGREGLQRFAALLDCPKLKKVRRWVQVAVSPEVFGSLDWQPNPPANFSLRQWRKEHGE